MDGQDWTVVTIKKSHKGTAASASASTGGTKSIVPRISGAQQAGAAAARKLEETEFGKPKSLSAESRNEIVQKRVALGKNQVQLNQDCRFPVNTVRDVENGKYCPSQQQLSMLNRVLRSALKFDKS